MSARTTIHDEDEHVLQIEFRQHGGEVARFAVFVLIIVAALYQLIPAARTAPGFLFAVAGVAIGWSLAALAGHEVYTVDAVSGVIHAAIPSPIGKVRQQVNMSDVSSIRLRTGGPDDNRLLVDLVDDEGRRLLSLPRRLTTLTAPDQRIVGSILAERLNVPLRGEGARL